MKLDVDRFRKRFYTKECGGDLTEEGRLFIEAFNRELTPEQVSYFGCPDGLIPTKGVEDINKEAPIWSKEIFEEVLAYVAMNNKQTKCGKAILELVARFDGVYCGYEYCFDYYLFLNEFYRIPVFLKLNHTKNLK
jgi:hypothetical protein